VVCAAAAEYVPDAVVNVLSPLPSSATYSVFLFANHRPNGNEPACADAAAGPATPAALRAAPPRAARTSAARQRFRPDAGRRDRWFVMGAITSAAAAGAGGHLSALQAAARRRPAGQGRLAAR
jgi:hypothetical protein